MGYTGYLVIQYIDENPNSPTYGQTWEERVLDTTTCPNGSGEWVIISDTCELDTSGYTGNRITVYYNSTTGEYSSTTVYDPSCVESSLDEIWISTGEEYCEENDDGSYTGYLIQKQKQCNPNLPNYGVIREIRVYSPLCYADAYPEWKEITRVCHLYSDDCVVTFDGTADVTQIDVNKSSPTYNQTRIINVEDPNCENCTNTVFSYSGIGDYCGSELLASGFSAISTTLYTVYRKYKTINGVDYPMDEYNFVVVEEESTDCGYIGPQYRWVTTNITVCVGTDLYLLEKKQVSYDLGVTWSDYFEDGQLVTRISQNPIAEDVYECGYPMYRWVETDETDCYEAAEYKWVQAPASDYICSGTSKYYKEYEYESTDGGDTWTPTGEYRIGAMIELKSLDCGYSFKITLRDVSSAYTVDCIEGYDVTKSFVTSAETRFYSGNSITSATVGDCATKICKNSFSYYRNSLESVSLGGTEIEEGTFSGFTNLRSVNISSSLTTINKEVFNGCSRLSSCTFDEGSQLTFIGEEVFYRCSGLTSINIPSGVTHLGGYAFYQCRNLSSVTFDEGSQLTYISFDTFDGCSSLTSIVIPSGVTSIGSGAFYYCTALTSIDIPNSVTSIGANAFYNCTALTSVNIPSGVTSIGNQAFGDCYSLSSITIPSSVTTIGNNAFYGCYIALSNFVNNSSLDEVANNYWGCTIVDSDINGLLIKDNSIIKYRGSYPTVTIPNSVTSIGGYVFYRCSGLTSVVFEQDSQLTSIGMQAFYACSGLTSINIPSGVTNIGGYAFQYCSGLTSITINRTTPPTLVMGAFYNTNDCPIYVPSGSVEAYKSANGWNTYASRIQAIP